MAKEKDPDREEPTDSKETAPKKKNKFRSFFRRKWVIVIIVATLVVQGVGAGYYCLFHAGSGNLKAEVSLGKFQFFATAPQGTRIAKADFHLHISLLEDVEAVARSLLTRHQFRVQQNVEQLLRQAHLADFEDPTLTELKRQLQETINRTLGKRVIGEVIITEFSIEHIASLRAGLPEEKSIEVPDDPNWEQQAAVAPE